MPLLTGWARVRQATAMAIILVVACGALGVVTIFYFRRYRMHVLRTMLARNNVAISQFRNPIFGLGTDLEEGTKWS